HAAGRGGGGLRLPRGHRRRDRRRGRDLPAEPGQPPPVRRPGHGGRCQCPGRQVIIGSTLAGNRADAGGAIDDSTDSLHVTASTLTGNTARVGGAIEVEGASFFYLRNSTLSGNSARPGTGGAIATYACGGGIVPYTTIAGNSSGLDLPCSNVEVTGTILASSVPGANCLGLAPREAAGYNLDSGAACHLAKPTDLTGGHPRLGPLPDNGGAAPTRASTRGSAALGPAGQPGHRRPAHRRA